MRKYFTAFIVFSILAIVMVGVCFVSFKPIESLMKPPMYGGENHEIQVAFEKSLDENYKLRAPLSGLYRSSYISEDLDNDGQEEIIVLYSTEDEVDIVKISFMMKQNNEWKVISKLESSYSDVHQIKFADIDGDGVMELLVGWTAYLNDLSRNLSVYKMPVTSSSGFEKIYSSSYLMFDAVDIDSDDVSDIAIFESSDDGIVLSYNQYAEGKITKKASITLDSSAYSVYSMSYDNGGKNDGLRMFIDSYKIDSGIITECIYWDSSDKVFRKIKNNGVSVLSSRLTGVECRDVNNDGLIEVPIEITLKGSSLISESDSAVQSQSIIKWVQPSDRDFSTVTHHLIYNNSDFGITFNEKWLKSVTVINNYKENKISFYSTEDDTKKLLFELVYTSTQLEEDALSNKYKLLTETKKGKLFYIIYNSDRNLNINKVYIEKTIVLYGG